MVLKNERFVFYALLISFFGTVPRLLWNDIAFIKSLALIFLSVSCVEIGWGYLQHYNLIPVIQKGYISGSFFNPNFLAAYLAVLFPVCGSLLYEFNNSQSRYYRNILIFLLICLVTLVIITQSRAAIVSILLTVAYGIYVFLKPITRYSEFYRKYKILLGVLFLFSTAIFIIVLVLFKYDSALGRILIWNVSLSMLSDFSIAGVGIGNFQQHYMNYQAIFFETNGLQHEMSRVASNVFYAFNDFLQVVVESGVSGFVVVVVFIFHLFNIVRHLLRCEKPGLKEGFSISVISFSVISLFSYPLLSPPHVILLAVCISVSVNRLKFLSSYRTSVAIIGKSVMSLFFIGVLVAGTWFIPKYYYFLNQWQHAQVLYRQGKFERSIEYFEKASQSVFCAGDFYANYGKALYLLQRYEPALTQLQMAEAFKNSDIVPFSLGNTYDALGKYQQAEKNYRNAINMVPSRFYSRYLLMQNLYHQQKISESVKTGNEILNMPVKIPSPAVDSIKAHVKQYLWQVQDK